MTVPARKEHATRGGFSLFAAATLLYMTAEYTETFLQTRHPLALVVAFTTGSLAVMEAHKVGTRVERVLGLRE